MTILASEGDIVNQAGVILASLLRLRAGGSIKNRDDARIGSVTSQLISIISAKGDVENTDSELTAETIQVSAGANFVNRNGAIGSDLTRAISVDAGGDLRILGDSAELRASDILLQATGNIESSGRLQAGDAGSLTLYSREGGISNSGFASAGQVSFDAKWNVTNSGRLQALLGSALNNELPSLRIVSRKGNIKNQETGQIEAADIYLNAVKGSVLNSSSQIGSDETKRLSIFAGDDVINESAQLLAAEIFIHSEENIKNKGVLAQIGNENTKAVYLASSSGDIRNLEGSILAQTLELKAVSGSILNIGWSNWR